MIISKGRYGQSFDKDASLHFVLLLAEQEMNSQILHALMVKDPYYMVRLLLQKSYLICYMPSNYFSHFELKKNVQKK